MSRLDLRGGRGAGPPRRDKTGGAVAATRRGRSAAPREEKSGGGGGGFHRRAMRRAWRQFHEGSLSHWTTTTIIALSLTIFGAFSLLVTNAETLLSSWRGDRMITVFTDPAASADWAADLAGRLAAYPLADSGSIRLISPQEAILHMKEMLGSEAGVLDELDENPLPFSVEFRLTPENHDLGARAAEEIAAWEGIDSVSYDRQWVDRLAALTQVARYVGHALSVLLLSAVALIISNTIKLTIIARRDEVEVMRFMGAANGFIKAPFIYEGILQGVLGSLFALGLTSLLHLGAREAARELGVSFGIHLQLHFLPWTHLSLLLVLGVALGLTGAMISLSRFLEV